MDHVRSGFVGRFTVLSGPSAAAAAVQLLCRLDARYRQRRALGALDDARRADLGLCLEDIGAELQKPIWRT